MHRDHARTTTSSRGRRIGCWSLVLAIGLADCSSRILEPTQASDVRQPPTLGDAAPTSRAAPVIENTVPRPDAGSTGDMHDGSTGTTTPASPPETVESNACSEGMQLVDGEYCSEVEQTCLKSWYDRPNQKEICERFATPSRCTGERLHKRFCIDRYEWPNRAGERPEVMNTFYQAQVKCAAVGKRMCTESEWTFACEGPEMKPYPYGYERDANKCNGDRPWDHPDMNAVAKRDPTELARLWQGVPSGSQPECVSDFGVHDLPGNADEVASSEPASPTSRAKHDNVTTGGPWYLGVRNQCRPKIYTHDEGFYYYYLGFRCCGEADDTPTDPRAPKQREGKVSFGYVERMARFSVKQVEEKLRLKSEGKCTCAERDITCKTLCGTLLGPDARDARPRE